MGRALTAMDLAGHPRPFKVVAQQKLNGQWQWVVWSTFVNRDNAERRAGILTAEGHVVKVLPELPRTVECVYCLGTLCDPENPGSCLL